MPASKLPLFLEHAPGQWQGTTAGGDTDRQNIEPVAKRRAVENQHHACVTHVTEDRRSGCLVADPDGQPAVHQQTAEPLNTAIFAPADEHVIGDTRQGTTGSQIQRCHQQRHMTHPGYALSG